MSFSRLIVTVAATLCVLWGQAVGAQYQKRPEVISYIASLVASHDLDKDMLLALFSRAQKQEHILEAMRRPYEAKPFPEYRKIFLTEQRIDNGARFWREHADLLKRVEHKYHVPTEYLLAIIGVETNFGASMGRTRTVDTLITLGFDYPRRAKFFRRELTHLLLLAREEGLGLEDLKGSYAGALGLGQFIPSSYREYAVDFDGDGKRDLWNVHDALASVANYLARHGWREEAPVAERLPATVTVTETNRPLFNKKAKPWLGDAHLTRLHGLQPGEKPFSLYSFESDDEGNEGWITYHNLYVITRYNHSHKYAFAVHQLSQAIKQRYTGP